MNGVLVTPERPGALIAAIDTVLADAEKLQLMRSRNQQKAHSYDIEQMANAYLAVYDEL